MVRPEELGIQYPNRAESIEEFGDYQVFLDHWEPLAGTLKEMYEGLAVRRETRALGVYGEQGSGKTLFRKKLAEDFDLCATQSVAQYDDNNLWHRMTASRDEDPETAYRATIGAKVFSIQDEEDWVDTVEEWLSGKDDQRAIVIADEADQAYFRQDLMELSDIEFAEYGDKPAAIQLAAQRFVKLCRTRLRGCVFVLLTNNEPFLEDFKTAVEEQHRGLLKRRDLEMPGGDDKETIVRVNTNRLNPVSYWYCLDKAGPAKKADVYHKLDEATTFPDSFEAVDAAIRTADRSRLGRPARKCLLTLTVLANFDDASSIDATGVGKVERTEFEYDWIRSDIYHEDWAQRILPDEREARLLESEWNMRVLQLGRPFVSALLGGEHDQCKKLLEEYTTYHGPGTHGETREETEQRRESLVDNWGTGSEADLEEFWERGQNRSGIYEPILRDLLDGYDISPEGVLSYRPDWVVRTYTPCSILAAESEDDINQAIRRDALVFEFTAQKRPTSETIHGYLEGKLPNYVKIVQEQ